MVITHEESFGGRLCQRFLSSSKLFRFPVAGKVNIVTTGKLGDTGDGSIDDVIDSSKSKVSTSRGSMRLYKSLLSNFVRRTSPSVQTFELAKKRLF
jgi:hypothetical protein